MNLWNEGRKQEPLSSKITFLFFTIRLVGLVHIWVLFFLVVERRKF